MLISGIHHVCMRCADAAEFEKTKKFYTDTLQLSIRRAWAGGCMIDAGNALIELFCDGNIETKRGIIQHFAFQVDDIIAVTERVKQAGYEIFDGPNDVEIPTEPPFPITFAFTHGPLGESIEFFKER